MKYDTRKRAYLVKVRDWENDTKLVGVTTNCKLSLNEKDRVMIKSLKVIPNSAKVLEVIEQDTITARKTNVDARFDFNRRKKDWDKLTSLGY